MPTNKTPTHRDDQSLHDEIRYCENCGITFLWTREEQLKDPAQRSTSDTDGPRMCAGCRQLLPPNGCERGLVKWFNHRKHYGFIIRRDAEEIFVHGSDVVGRRTLRPGELVEFRVEMGDRGPAAKALRVIGRSDDPPP